MEKTILFVLYSKFVDWLDFARLSSVAKNMLRFVLACFISCILVFPRFFLENLMAAVFFYDFAVIKISLVFFLVFRWSLMVSFYRDAVRRFSRDHGVVFFGVPVSEVVYRDWETWITGAVEGTGIERWNEEYPNDKVQYPDIDEIKWNPWEKYDRNGNKTTGTKCIS